MSEARTRLAGLAPAAQEKAVRALPAASLRAWAGRFEEWAHEGQRPAGDDWATWVVMGGRVTLGHAPDSSDEPRLTSRGFFFAFFSSRDRP